MTQDLADKLIAHYELAISKCNDVANSVDEVYKVCVDMYVENGICHCAYQVFDGYIYNDEWVKMKCFGNYICKTPTELFTANEIIHSLQTRIDILKTFNPS